MKRALLFVLAALAVMVGSAAPAQTPASDTNAATLRALKRYDELRRLLAGQERADPSPVRREQACFEIAESFREEGKAAEALAGYERVFTAHPEVNSAWQDAQTRIVDVLADLKRYDEALKAAHVLLDAALDAATAERRAQRIAEIIKQAETNAIRADAVVAMQRFGPAGKDGKAGTADDPPAVLAAIGYPDYAPRRAAFEAAAPALGDGVEAALQRGWCGVFAGDPRAAVAQFADAFRRCQIAQAADVAEVLMMNGMRAVQGHSAGLAEVGRFIARGPAGPDGKPGTPDDVADPFAVRGLAAGSAPSAGLVPLSAEDAAQLKALGGELRELIGRSENAERRLAAVSAYQRACETMAPGDRAEFTAWVCGVMRQETDGRILGALARLGETVAKSGQLHLGGVREFWVDVGLEFERAKRPIGGDAANARREFEGMAAALEKRPPGGRR